MAAPNFYPELPVIAYQRTSIGMPFIKAFGSTLIGKYTKDTVRMAYAIFRNESGNGIYGVNNNYAGIQADNARWSDLPGEPVATCVRVDNAGDTRRFLCFDKETGYQISFELLCIKVQQREMITVDDYFNKWVADEKEDTAQARKDFASLLESAAISFP